MHFQLSPAQKKIYDEAGELGRSAFSGRAAECDRDATLPVANLAALREHGLLRLTISKKRGGRGSGAKGEDPLLYLLAIEQTARYCLNTAQCLHIHSHGSHYIDNVASPDLADRVLGPVVEEGALLTFTGSEPGRTSRGLYKLTTTARKVKDGYVLNGVKNYATLADVAAYNIIFVVDPESEGTASHLGFAVSCKAEGHTIVPHSWDPMGMRGAVSPTIKMENCFVRASEMVGKPGVFPEGRWQAKFHLGFAAQYLGGTEGIADFLQQYLPKRGTTKDAFTQLRMGEIRVGIESVRGLIYNAAALWAQKKEQEAELFAMVAKHHAIANAVVVMNKAAQIAGSSAYLGNSPLSRFTRDLRVHTLHENLDRTAETLGRAFLGESFDTTARL